MRPSVRPLSGEKFGAKQPKNVKNVQEKSLDYKNEAVGRCPTPGKRKFEEAMGDEIGTYGGWMTRLNGTQPTEHSSQLFKIWNRDKKTKLSDNISD